MVEFVYPMLLLVLLTMAILLTIGVGRVLAIKERQVSIKTFRLMDGKVLLSSRLQQLDRNFTNLLEVPVLFYLWCLVVMVLQLQATELMTLAWVYVGMRVVHSFIHVTYNNVNHRFLVFVSSCLLLIAMWLRLLFLV